MAEIFFTVAGFPSRKLRNRCYAHLRREVPAPALKKARGNIGAPENALFVLGVIALLRIVEFVGGSSIFA